MKLTVDDVNFLVEALEMLKEHADEGSEEENRAEELIQKFTSLGVDLSGSENNWFNGPCYGIPTSSK